MSIVAIWSWAPALTLGIGDVRHCTSCKLGHCPFFQGLRGQQQLGHLQMGSACTEQMNTDVWCVDGEDISTPYCICKYLCDVLKFFR